MNKYHKKIFSFLGIASEDDLMDKTLKVSFIESDESDDHDLQGSLVPTSIFFKITSFTLTDSELFFPPLPYHQGGQNVQVTVSSRDSYQIYTSLRDGSPHGCYEHKIKHTRAFLFKGKIQLIK